MRILLAEDDEIALTLTTRILLKNELVTSIDSVATGRELVSYLSDSPPPDIIITDINMPEMDGLEAIRVIKNNPALCSIPIIVLSSSDLDSDVKMAYSLGADYYKTKPSSIKGFLRLIMSINVLLRQKGKKDGLEAA